nr:tetratricopeptide repeat-containing glycosyltransferase family protein [Bradyrhizobium sp.]
MNRRERRSTFKASKVAQHQPSATTPAALYEAGVHHLSAGRHLDAQICCQKALALDAGHADTLHLTGLLCLQAGQLDHAIEWISRAIRQQPKTDYLTNLGNALLKLGRREEALATFDKAVQLEPDNAGLWKTLGDVLADMVRLAEAILTYQHALKLNPRLWEAAHKAGTLLHQLGRTEEALDLFSLHEQMPADDSLKLQMRALSMYILERFEEGLQDIQSAHTIDPTDAGTCSYVGVFLRQLKRDEEALPWFDQAIRLRPDFLGAFHNKALALVQLHRFDGALAIYDQMKAISSSAAAADFDASLIQLLTGNFETGWAGREARSNVPGLAVSRFEFSQPRWLGKESLAGKTILVPEDEGMGDTIQFARYLPMLAARGARVIVRVNDPVLPLLAGIQGVSQCIPHSVEALPAFDLYCPVGSLPLAFETRLDTIPPGVGYLPQPSEARMKIWEDRLSGCFGVEKKLRVGLVWSGNPKHLNDRNRSIPMQLYLRLLDLDAAFISLQKDPRPDDKAVLEQADIIDVSTHLTDFTETAALINCLDLVITVDTSVAHLAGALGLPTWILLSYQPDWRWLLDRDDSPWYPTVRLFRQDETRNYGPVLDKVRSELAAMIAARKSR